MSGKDVLKKVGELKRKVMSTQEEITFWKARKDSPTGSTTEQSFNPNRNIESVQNLCVEKIDELEKKLAKELEEYEQHYEKTLRNIMKLDNMDYKKFLVAKFLDELPWEQIVNMMGYCDRYTYKFKNDAIAAFSRIINSTGKDS